MAHLFALDTDIVGPGFKAATRPKAAARAAAVRPESHDQQGLRLKLEGLAMDRERAARTE